MGKIKDINYYVVQGFMVQDLHLKGLEKDIYAIIYGFSQSDGQTFKGSLQYLCDWTCSSKQGVINALKSLIDKKLIVKKGAMRNGVKFVEYHATELTEVLNSVDQALKKVDGGSQQSLHNNIVDNIDENITNNIDEEEKEKYIIPKTWTNDDISKGLRLRCRVNNNEKLSEIEMNYLRAFNDMVENQGKPKEEKQTVRKPQLDWDEMLADLDSVE